jgi:hypothetical protein
MGVFTSHKIETVMGDRAVPGTKEPMITVAAQLHFLAKPGGYRRLGGTDVVCHVWLSGASAE